MDVHTQVSLLSALVFYLADFCTALTYCHVYLNRQMAAAHQFIFQKVEEIVLEDTGKALQWRHLHAHTIHEYIGILHWSADQHGGQAKGEFILPLSVTPRS